MLVNKPLKVLWVGIIVFSIAFPVYKAYQGLEAEKPTQHAQTVNPHVLVLSFATDPTHPMHQLLIKTNPYPMVSLGNQQQWRGLRDKLKGVKSYLSKHHLQHSNRIIIFADGYDTFFTKNKGDIVEKFMQFNKPLVISAEIGCWPPHAPVCSEPKSHPYPSSPTPFRYLNAGTYMGYAWAIYAMLDEALKKHPQEREDQYLLQDFFMAHREKIALDYYQEIFSPLFGTKENDFKCNKKTGEITNLITHTKPLILHGNGGPPVKKLLLKLYKKSESHYKISTVTKE